MNVNKVKKLEICNYLPDQEYQDEISLYFEEDLTEERYKLLMNLLKRTSYGDFPFKGRLFSQETTEKTLKSLLRTRFLTEELHDKLVSLMRFKDYMKSFRANHFYTISYDGKITSLEFYIPLFEIERVTSIFKLSYLDDNSVLTSTSRTDTNMVTVIITIK
jgi:hypothetical protein